MPTILDTTGLAERFRGSLIRAEDPSYDEARSIWNGMIDKHPALIAHCAGVADVIDDVRYARNGVAPGGASRGGGPVLRRLDAGDTGRALGHPLLHHGPDRIPRARVVTGTA